MASGLMMNDETDDTEFPEPIYLRLDNHTQPPDYAYFRDEEDDDDELADEDASIDLSAPPPESWFHGGISRQVAVNRLEAMGMAGSYLIRESEAHPGDYAISYLSASRAVHHFKIHSHCGDFYIGGRQFYSLGDLVGFYSNNSCILENESLYVPVLPPKPVPLHVQLKATDTYTKTPDTDELSIEAGDVFLLLTRLTDVWGWGRSQRTGDNGLIPLAIMEDVTDQDVNLGKPWFHPTISKEGAMDLLMTTNRVGTFLIRPSETGRYSLAVRTPDKVQRFLIQKDVSGYFLFGGRQFNCLDDVISRYRKEDILEGLKLDEPVPYFDKHRSLPKASPLLPRQPDVNKNQSHVQTSSTGDKTGLLLLKKGKKYPVPGQWKGFYFVLKFDEHKLLFYEHENSHRAKGLLDLKQCKVYMAHPSLYGRNDCFVLRLHYLNEQYLHYMCAETATAAESWLQTLRKCMGADDVFPTGCAEVQQIRSLALSIQDCKLAKPASNVCCLVSIDGVCVARTKVEQDTPCVFDESYQFEALPPYAETFSVEVEASSKGKRFTLLKDTPLGRVTVHLTDLPNGQQDDQWHQLLVGTTKVSRGSIRLAARFKHEVILPYEEYKQLKELLLSDNLTAIETLAQVCKDHHAELASTLIHIFCRNDRVIPILAACLGKAVESEDISTLFRASTLPTMLMDQFMKLTGIDYLHSILKVPIEHIVQSQDVCELNPSNLPKGTDLMQNSERLQTHLANILNAIYSSATLCPMALRQVFKHLQEEVVKKWPTDGTVRTRAVSGFLFLRFICPAMLKPQIFNLVTAPPSPNAERTLKLIAKGMQNLANLVEFKAKEPFMTVLNPFIQKNLIKMKQFVNDLSSVKEGSDVTHVELQSDGSRDLAAVYHLCVTYEKPLEDAAKKHPELKLMAAISSIRTAEKKYLNKYS